METLLITKTDFAPYRSLTINMDDHKRLEPFILEAQRIDLVNLLGQRLYFDMVKYITDYNAGMAAAAANNPPGSYTATVNEQWFQKLLNGCSYTHTWPDRSTTTKIYSGLKPVLVYLSYARFVRSDNVRSTQSGFVKKTVDFSVQVSDKEIQAVAARAESDANAFFTGTENFMTDNADYFAKYINDANSSAGTQNKRTGTRLSAIKGNNSPTIKKRYISY
jgi:hypothetical protein